MIWVVLVLVLFIFQVLTVLIAEYKHPSKAIAWLSILFFLPVVGFVMYYFLARGFTARRRVVRSARRHMLEMQKNLVHQSREDKHDAKERLPIEDDVRLFGLLGNLPGSPITKCNETEVLSCPEAAYDSILASMETAKDHIHMEYYTVRDDETGRRFQEMLIRKAREGVTVRFLVDGIGSVDLGERFLRGLREAGVETGCFLPPLFAMFDKRLNYRNHRKIVVVDGKIGYLGGVNIGDEYMGKNPRLGFWRDTHFKICGDAVYYLQNTFIQDWRFAKKESLHEERYYPEHDCEGRELVQIVNSGPDSHWDTILEVYFSAIASANHQVFVTTPYFIPDPSLVMALKTAAISGVDVRIIFPAIPDTKIVHWASWSFLEELLQSGVRFYEYKKGFIHAKIVIVDHKIATVGTANMDMRSFFSNFEQNAVLFDKHVIRRLERDFIQDLKESREVQLAEFEQRSRMQRAKEKIGRLLAPLF